VSRYLLFVSDHRCDRLTFVFDGSAGEFESLPQIPHEILPPNLSESRYMIEKAAYLGFAAAQYKIGWCYEYSQITCPFDPLLSVEYYSLASQQVSRNFLVIPPL
jgi:TPR repeat protein